MRIAVIVIIALIAGVVGLGAFRMTDSNQTTSDEVVYLTAEKRDLLKRLRSEKKFAADDMYTGMATPEDEVIANAAVHALIDGVLVMPNDKVSAKATSGLIGKGIKSLAWLETADRDRAYDYFREVWYIIGFKGAIGHFDYGSYYTLPEGYGEPLPPGWTAPDQPRRIP